VTVWSIGTSKRPTPAAPRRERPHRRAADSADELRRLIRAWPSALRTPEGRLADAFHSVGRRQPLFQEQCLPEDVLYFARVPREGSFILGGGLLPMVRKVTRRRAYNNRPFRHFDGRGGGFRSCGRVVAARAGADCCWMIKVLNGRAPKFRPGAVALLDHPPHHRRGLKGASWRISYVGHASLARSTGGPHLLLHPSGRGSHRRFAYI